MKNVIIYTDGACSCNPGPGGWGAVLMFGKAQKQISGFEANTTNNRMEMLAVINALKLLKEPCIVDLYSDSAYVVNAFLQDWVGYWKTHNWRTSGKKEVKNIPLWNELLELCDVHQITWHKVKGHADNEYNNLCDKLARDEVDKYLATLPKE
ncbi:MAG: ribonuclease HI [Clostridia bacterium]|nr:ribonuclease HI [Clostridia bacterium]